MSQTENIQIIRLVKIESESGSRVAYDLMLHIAGHEAPTSEQKKSRTYWLTLYHQCEKAVAGRSLENILQEK
jgi:hypothetical protein